VTNVSNFSISFPSPELLPCELNLNLHPKPSHYSTDTSSERKPCEKEQHGVCYRVCFGMRGVVLRKSGDVKVRMQLVSMIREEMRKEV